jgi:hypothetical protein
VTFLPPSLRDAHVRDVIGSGAGRHCVVGGHRRLVATVALGSDNDLQRVVRRHLLPAQLPQRHVGELGSGDGGRLGVSSRVVLQPLQPLRRLHKVTPRLAAHWTLQRPDTNKTHTTSHNAATRLQVAHTDTLRYTDAACRERARKSIMAATGHDERECV